MADLKISQLSSATALAGTEVFPVVQDGATKKATIDQILTPAAGKGVDFSANTSAPGAVSELLDWYEEGTFTPTIVGTSSAGVGTYTTQVGRYTRIGNRVMFNLSLDWSAHTGTGNMRIGGLPFTSNATADNYSTVSILPSSIALTANNMIYGIVNIGSTQILLYQALIGGGGVSFVALDTAGLMYVSGQYEV